MNKKIIIGSIIVLGILSLAYIFTTVFKTSNISLPIQSKKLQVITSFYPMYFFASQIGGNVADVQNITPAGTEPHDYEPTTRDIVNIENADMLILNGGTLETWGDKIKNELQGKNTIIIVAGEDLVLKQMEENQKTIRDPHVWLDPILAKQEVEKIEKGFEKTDPKDALYFQENAKMLEDKLTQLDEHYREGLKNCLRKDFVTSHAAFAYLAERYNINQIAIAGISPDEEPSLQKLADISTLINQKSIKIIFFESLVSPKLSETIAQETGASTLTLDPIEGISDDNLKAGHTYLTIMEDNLHALQLALQCNK